MNDVAEKEMEAIARLMEAEELLREALTLREMGNQGPYKSKVREFLEPK